MNLAACKIANTPEVLFLLFLLFFLLTIALITTISIKHVNNSIKSDRNYTNFEIMSLISKGGTSKIAINKVYFEEIDRSVFEQTHNAGVFFLVIVMFALGFFFLGWIPGKFGC